MSNMTIEDRISRIHRIAIQDQDLSMSPRVVRTMAKNQDRAAMDEDSAAVAGGSIISFVGDLSRQTKATRRHNSTLFAQLAANANYNRQDDMTKWHEYYGSVLEQLGWTMRSFKLARVNDSDVTSIGSVDKLLLSFAEKYFTGGEVALFRSTIDPLKRTENASAVKGFESSAKSFNKANFQVGVVSNAVDNAVFKIGAYAFETDRTLDEVLFFKTSQNVFFYADNQTMVLNGQIYGVIRQTVLDKLGENANNFIDVEI
ncbi:hypothetical protein BN946_scf185015.g149 [Trametes cinnabarina]|uniref:Uncharacterized protein n=1 Tax=Pycnoporus cinnabarinus TaxID=5643 RepID=A0A060SHH6_PYCCI|nr:hypothetical protein BN946_scf185015.g149 [Trametes cinnabarina]